MTVMIVIYDEVIGGYGVIVMEVTKIIMVTRKMMVTTEVSH